MVVDRYLEYMADRWHEIQERRNVRVDSGIADVPSTSLCPADGTLVKSELGVLDLDDGCIVIAPEISIATEKVELFGLDRRPERRKVSVQDAGMRGVVVTLHHLNPVRFDSKS